MQDAPPGLGAQAGVLAYLYPARALLPRSSRRLDLPLARHSSAISATHSTCAPLFVYLFALRAAPLEARRAWHMRAAPAVNTHVPITLILSQQQAERLSTEPR